MFAAEKEESFDTYLCYQALGISISDPPQRINEVYARLVRECRAEFNSPDPKIREGAREQLATLEKMYHTIRNSVSYASMASQEKKKAGGTGEAAVAEVRVSRQVTICPSCSAQISKASQSCPYCRASFLSKWQKFRRRYLTLVSVLSFFVFAATISLALAML